MIVQPSSIFVKDQANGAVAGDSPTELAEQYAADPSSVLAGAIERNLNVVISKKPGLGVVNSTLAQLQEVNNSVLLVELFPLNLFKGSRIFEPSLNQDVEVAVFDEIDIAGIDMKDAVVELMTTRSLNGTKYPKLKSVVLFLNESDDETEVKGASFANLAPSLSLEWN